MEVKNKMESKKLSQKVRNHTTYVQSKLPGMDMLDPPLADLTELEELSAEDRGAVFTKKEVVECILDLVGYKSNRRLDQKRLLEPAFGHGSFLFCAIDRLINSWSRYGKGDPSNLENSIAGIELHSQSFELTRDNVIDHLIENGISKSWSKKLVGRWLKQGDFLLQDIYGGFDFVVGNPPYVRIERIPRKLMNEYRKKYATMYDRADLYVPFIERSLDLLEPKGRLGFICADRWTKNRYGGPLREKITKNFHLEHFVDMTGVSAFESDVIAYPAITIVSKDLPGPTMVIPAAHVALSEIAGLKQTEELVVDRLPKGSSPWIFSRCKSSQLLRTLEFGFPLIEEVGCKIGIGVATGADRVFIAPFHQLDVEPERKLRLVTTKDIAGGRVEWKGLGVLNPFADNGKLIELDDFPKFKQYVERHKSVLRARHVSKKSNGNWFRTIDRINTELARTPKLLIPDIKGVANVVVEGGKLYPHHNLYFITPGDWQIEALRVVLATGIAHLFVSHYSTKMRGGYFRYQAQNLRRVRLPFWSQVQPALREQLTSAEKEGTVFDRVELVAKLFDLNKSQKNVLRDHSRETVICASI